MVMILLVDGMWNQLLGSAVFNDGKVRHPILEHPEGFNSNAHIHQDTSAKFNKELNFFRVYNAGFHIRPRTTF